MSQRVRPDLKDKESQMGKIRDDQPYQPIENLLSTTHNLTLVMIQTDIY